MIHPAKTKRAPLPPVLLFSDVHEGLVSWGRPRTEEIQRAEEAILAYANRHEPSLIICGGDLLDSFRYPGDEPLLRAASFLSALRNVPSRPDVVVCGGNHDWAGIQVLPALADDRLHVLFDPDVLRLRGWEIMVLPYLRRHRIPAGGLDSVVFDLADRLENPEKAFLVGHVPVEGTVPGLREETLSLACLETLRRKGVRHSFFGHIHQHKPLEHGAWYLGASIRNAFGETGSDLGVCLMDGDGTVTSLPLPGKDMTTIRYDSLQSLSSKVVADLKSCEDGWVRIRVKGAEAAGRLQASLASAFGGEIPERIAVVESQDTDVPDAPETQEGLSVSFEDGGTSLADEGLDVRNLWEQYVRTQEKSDEEEREMLLHLGATLLSPDGAAKSIEELWADLLERSQAVPERTPLASDDQMILR